MFRRIMYTSAGNGSSKSVNFWVYGGFERGGFEIGSLKYAERRL